MVPPQIRQGAQGTYDTASNGSLDNEFGTHKDEDVIKQILEKGVFQETEVSYNMSVSMRHCLAR